MCQTQLDSFLNNSVFIRKIKLVYLLFPGVKFVDDVLIAKVSYFGLKVQTVSLHTTHRGKDFHYFLFLVKSQSQIYFVLTIKLCIFFFIFFVSVVEEGSSPQLRNLFIIKLYTQIILK